MWKPAHAHSERGLCEVLDDAINVLLLALRSNTRLNLPCIFPVFFRSEPFLNCQLFINDLHAN